MLCLFDTLVYGWEWKNKYFTVFKSLRGSCSIINALLQKVIVHFNKYEHRSFRFFLPLRQSSIFSVAGKFCLAHGPRQLSRDVKHDVGTQNFRSDVTFALPQKTQKHVRKRSLCDVKCQK